MHTRSGRLRLLTPELLTFIVEYAMPGQASASSPINCFPPHLSTTQHNTIQHNTTQYNTIQHNTKQHNTACIRYSLCGEILNPHHHLYSMHSILEYMWGAGSPRACCCGEASSSSADPRQPRGAYQTAERRLPFPHMCSQVKRRRAAIILYTYFQYFHPLLPAF